MIYFQVCVLVIECLLVAGLGIAAVQAIGGPVEPSVRRRRLGNSLLGFSIFIFFVSGITKFAHFPPAVAEMTSLGLSGWKLQLVASIELTSGVLASIPRLRALALPFVSAHAGGAITAHLIAGQYFAMVPSSVVLSSFWLGSFLLYPQALWSLGQRSLVSKEAGDVTRLAPAGS